MHGPAPRGRTTRNARRSNSVTSGHGWFAGLVRTDDRGPVEWPIDLG